MGIKLSKNPEGALKTAIKHSQCTKYFIKESAEVITSSSHPHPNNHYAGWNIQYKFPRSNNEAFNYCGSSCSEGEQCIISISARRQRPPLSISSPRCCPPPALLLSPQPRRRRSDSLFFPKNSFGSQRHKILESRTNPRDQLVHFLIIFFPLPTVDVGGGGVGEWRIITTKITLIRDEGNLTF